jgi:hypothetical protein
MESPFEEFRKKNIILYLEPILEKSQNVYISVLTLSDMPEGPISKMVRRISSSSLSPFQTFSSNSSFSPFPNCVYILSRYTTPVNNHYMSSEDIPSVLGYLRANGYHVDTSFLHAIPSILDGVSENRYSGNRKVICIFSLL